MEVISLLMCTVELGSCVNNSGGEFVAGVLFVVARNEYCDGRRRVVSSR